jgi:hypothetical protein
MLNRKPTMVVAFVHRYIAVFLIDRVNEANEGSS